MGTVAAPRRHQQWENASERLNRLVRADLVIRRTGGAWLPSIRTDMTLRIDRISKTYPNGVRALSGISLTIPPGMFGLLGPNGAGKSSLMRTIATLQPPDSGGIHFRDIDV
jgi:ABC-type bacteriocin/lantibiotic exporter with double-glycine peptidase domain